MSRVRRLWRLLRPVRCPICRLPLSRCPQQAWRARRVDAGAPPEQPQFAHLRHHDGSVRREGFVILRGMPEDDDR